MFGLDYFAFGSRMSPRDVRFEFPKRTGWVALYPWSTLYLVQDLWLRYVNFEVEIGNCGVQIVKQVQVVIISPYNLFLHIICTCFSDISDYGDLNKIR